MLASASNSASVNLSGPAKWLDLFFALAAGEDAISGGSGFFALVGE